MKKNNKSFQHIDGTKSEFKPEKRISVDRRQFSYSFYIPERRSGDDRRSPLNREMKPE
jgi:hypothetical protein